MISNFAEFCKRQSYGDGRLVNLGKGRWGPQRCAEVDMRVLQWGKILMGYLCRVYDTVCLSQPIEYTAQRSPSVSQND